MTEQNYNDEQKLRELLNAIEFDNVTGTLTINGDLKIKGHLKVTGDVTAFCDTTIPDTKIGEKLGVLSDLQTDNENLRYENQRLSIINHYHRNEG